MKTRSFVISMLCLALIIFARTRPVQSQAQKNEIPQDVLTLIAPSDTLLAYKAADLYDDGAFAAVMVVRHQISGKSDYDFDNNPCELEVLHRENGTLLKVDHSKKAVDCTFNDIARNAKAMTLNGNLVTSVASIVYVNQKDKGDSTFYFAWSKQRKAWYLQRATASNVEGTSVANNSASYPADFAWTTMAEVDPDAISRLLDK